jgi:uncharacterized protein (TIGR02596 family)
MKHPSSGVRGFSLIELMVVVLIIGIIAAFAVPAASTILKGNQMNQAATILNDQINLARQTALSKSHPVDVRLIRWADPEVPGEVTGTVGNPTNGCFRAIQIMETLDAIDPTTTDFIRLPVDKPAVLPQSIVISKGIISTIIADAQASPTASPSQVTGKALQNDPAMPRNIGQNYDYIWFRFLPDGSTNLPPTGSHSDPSGAWCITLQNLTDPPAGNTPPRNFFTIQIDPVSGTIKPFRPGLSLR